MFRVVVTLRFSGRGLLHTSITGRPFSRPIQEALHAFVLANSRLTSQYWITQRLADSLGISVKPDEAPCTIPQIQRTPPGMAAPPVVDASPASGGGSASIVLYNAEQTTQPSLFGPSMCRQQRIPVSHHNKVVMGEAFSSLRAAMMTNGIYSPYWLPREMAEQCLGLTVRPNASVVSVGGIELVSSEHTSDGDLARKVIVAMYAPCLLSSGAEITHAPAYFTLKAAHVRRRLRSEFWARKEELVPRLLQLDPRQRAEAVSVALAEGEPATTLFNLDDTMPLERVAAPKHHVVTPVAQHQHHQQPVVEFDEQNIEPPDDIDTIPMAPVLKPVEQPPPAPAPSPHRGPSAGYGQQHHQHRRQHQNQFAASGGGGSSRENRGNTTSLLRPPQVTRRDVVLSVEARSIEDGLVDFVHDASSGRVFLVVRNGELRLDLTSLGVHVSQ